MFSHFNSNYWHNTVGSFSPWVVDSPVFLPLQLDHKCLDVVIMWSKSLCSRRCQVSGLKQKKTNKTKENTHLLAASCIPKGFQDIYCARYLHVGSCHAAKLLLEDGQHAPHCGGKGLGIQHTDGAATLANGDMTRIIDHCKLAACVRNMYQCSITL